MHSAFEVAVGALLADCARRGISPEAFLLEALMRPVRPEIDAAISAVAPAAGEIINRRVNEVLARSEGGADIGCIPAAIEADAGEPLPDLRRVLAEVQIRTGRVTAAEQMIEGGEGSPV
ncbi:hypothetical protein [Burkholderia pseudomallei]|uniref:hypothetical protein n=1 Tax=Burkholderia pseudomallei TaxID=28450 RepID=UPI0012AEC22F|nr:hypothetical protein [Burkholderia pseudomallei]